MKDNATNNVMNTDDVKLFLVISESESLAQAARRLAMTPMTVSRRLMQLEKQAGRRLVQRTTRAISLTQEGIEFLPYAKTIAEADASARALFQNEFTGASGLLRITAPSGLGRRNIIPLVPQLLQENPGMCIDLQLNDKVADIVSEGFDVAVRVAPLRDSNLVARKISENPRVLCASPHYLSRSGCPQSLSDLKHHECLRLSDLHQWIFTKNGDKLLQAVSGRFTSGNVEGIRELCISGYGLAQLTRHDIARELESGELTEIILQDALPQVLFVWAVLPTSKFIPQRVTAFINALRQELSGKSAVAK